MVERRTIGVAMDMTPAKLAFIKGEPKSEPPPKAPDASAKSIETTIEVESPNLDSQPAREAPQRAPRRSGRRVNQDVPDANEVLDQVKVSVTTRLPHRLAQALRRAYMEQKIKRANPTTQEKIMEEALGDWLAQHGYLESL